MVLPPRLCITGHLPASLVSAEPSIAPSEWGFAGRTAMRENAQARAIAPARGGFLTLRRAAGFLTPPSSASSGSSRAKPVADQGVDSACPPPSLQPPIASAPTRL